MAFTYEYPRPCVTVDAALLTLGQSGLEVLLIKRGRDPFKGRFALPGGFLDPDEPPVIGAARELAEETSVTDVELRPLFACGQPDRDPRSRNITMVFGALIAKNRVSPKGGDDAELAEWHSLNSLPLLAFDHAVVIAELQQSILWQAQTALIGRQYLSKVFSGEELRALHAAVGAPGFETVDTEELLQRGQKLGLLRPAPSGSPAAPSRWAFCPDDRRHPDFAATVW